MRQEQAVLLAHTSLFGSPQITSPAQLKNPATAMDFYQGRNLLQGYLCACIAHICTHSTVVKASIFSIQ